MKRFRKAGIIALVVALTAGSAFAAAGRKPIDMGRKADFTIENLCCSKVSYSVYKVADITAGSRLSWTPEVSALLAKYENPISVVQESQEDWSRVAETLAVYAAEDSALPAAERVLQPLTGTKSNGSLKFTDLDFGIYLAFAPDHSNGTKRHTVRPFVITLPGENPGDGDWEYDVAVKPKFSETGDGAIDEDTIRRRVKKVWEDAEDEAGARPTSIRVQLLRDGRPYGEEVELSEDNQWGASFDDLSAAYSWDLREVSVPDDYTMTVSETGTTFLIVNTYTTEIIDDDPPLSDLPVLPGGNNGTPGGSSDVSGELTDLTDEDVPLARLPQTGALWWPVLPLLCGGIFFYALGVRKSRRA